ncbi:hypothetical protein ACJX0J_034535, partial [Zea mays]
NTHALSKVFSHVTLQFQRLICYKIKLWLLVVSFGLVLFQFTSLSRFSCRLDENDKNVHTSSLEVWFWILFLDQVILSFMKEILGDYDAIHIDLDYLKKLNLYFCSLSILCFVVAGHCLIIHLATIQVQVSNLTMIDNAYTCHILLLMRLRSNGTDQRKYRIMIFDIRGASSTTTGLQIMILAHAFLWLIV